MSPALNGSSALQRFERGNAVKIRNRMPGTTTYVYTPGKGSDLILYNVVHFNQSRVFPLKPPLYMLKPYAYCIA